MNGPLTVDDVHQWLAEGRVNESLARPARRRNAWQPLGAIPELRRPSAAGQLPTARTPRSTPPIAGRGGRGVPAARRHGWTPDGASRAGGRSCARISSCSSGAATVVWTILIALTFVPRIGWLAGMVVNSPLLGGLYFAEHPAYPRRGGGGEKACDGFRRAAFVPLVRRRTAVAADRRRSGSCCS